MASTPPAAWQNQEQRQGYSGARLDAPDYGQAAIGRAVAGFGQDASHAVDNLTDIAKRDAETAAREADNIRTANRLKVLYGDGADEPGYFNREGRNALEERPKLDEKLAKIDADAAAILEHKPFARRMFDEMTVRRNMDDMPRVAAYTSKQRNVYEDQVDADAFDLAIDNATSATDPKIIEQNLITVADIAERQARRKGMSDDNTIKQARQTATGKAVESIAQKIEIQSPMEAQAFVVAHAGDMDPNDASKLLATLDNNASQERAGHDISNFLVFNGFPNAHANGVAAQGASEGAPAGPTAIPSDDALDAAQFTGPGAQEGAAAHTNRDGSLITSPKGATGVTQVMFETGKDPGFGVKPLQNQSREEYLRFGRDYRKALLKYYNGNITLALTAYNWGPGNVDNHIKEVGDPRTGAISDAAWINSIGVKEAREYAPAVLSRAGVSVSGKTPTGGVPAQVGQEIDLEQTINNIRNSDRTWNDKQALIAEATRMHGYGKQARAEREDQLKDDAWKALNGLKSFTDYNQLPLSIRKRMEVQMPELVNTFKNMAEANASQAGTADNKEFKTQLADLEQNLYAFMWAHPREFQQIDFYGNPKWAKMGTEKVTEWMKRQQESIESGQGKGADHDKIRTEINRFAPDKVKKDDKKMGAYFDIVSREENRILSQPDRKGKPLTDDERRAIVTGLLTQAVYTNAKGEQVTGTVGEAKQAGVNKYQVQDKYAFARAQLQLRLGYEPTPQQVNEAVRQYEARTGAK